MKIPENVIDIGWTRSLQWWVHFQDHGYRARAWGFESKQEAVDYAWEIYDAAHPPQEPDWFKHLWS